MKFARINDENLCADFIDFDPTGKFHPSMVYVQVPEHLEAFVNNEYKLEDGQIVPPSLEYLRDQIKARLADIRFAKETSGIELPDGTAIHTDRESQAQVTSAFNSLKNALVPTIRWKAKNGWVTLTLAEVEPVAQAVASYVAACFAAEASVSEQLDAITDEQQLAQFDIETALEVELA